MLAFLKRSRKAGPALISLLAVAAGVFSYYMGIPFLDLMELKTVDLRFVSRGPTPPHPDVVLAVVDEKSLSAEGKWVWPRSKMADLVRRLSQAGARVVAFDVAFLEPEDHKIVQAIESIQAEAKQLGIGDNRLHDYLENLKALSDNDRLLAEAVAQSEAAVVLGYFFQLETEGVAHVRDEEIDIHQKNCQGSRYEYVRFTSPDVGPLPMIQAVFPQSNIEIVAQATPFSGFFNQFPDPDGTVRWIPAVVNFRDSLYAPLALMAASVYLDAPVSVRIAEYGIEALRLGRQLIPCDEIGRILINYHGGPKTFPHLSITDILHGRVPEEAIKDKIVLVGATATGIYDTRVTPFDTVFPGPEIHANIISSILQNRFLTQPAWASMFDVLAMVLCGMFLGFILPRTGVLAGALTGSVLFFGYILVCQYFFAQRGMILNLVYPLSVMLVIYVGITAYKYLAESRQKSFIRNAFSTYLAPSVVKQLIESPEKLVLGGEEREITAFFSDIQGFTGISERLSASELVELLNEFLTEMTDIILGYQGTVDKFEGDAIIAMFGAPNVLPNHGEVACRACIDMQKRLTQLRLKWKEEGKPELRMRIGLYTGPAVVGNMGSKTRMDYTMMGDTVNTASRLEGVNKAYGSYILVGESTYRAAGGEIVGRELDSINVVGKKEPVSIYQLLGAPAEIDERLQKIMDRYAEGLSAYRKRDWDGAVVSFQAALSIDPDDAPSRSMVNRCLEYRLAPPPADWNGSYSMKTK